MVSASSFFASSSCFWSIEFLSSSACTCNINAADFEVQCYYTSAPASDDASPSFKSLGITLPPFILTAGQFIVEKASSASSHPCIFATTHHTDANVS